MNEHFGYSNCCSLEKNVHWINFVSEKTKNFVDFLAEEKMIFIQLRFSFQITLNYL